MKGIVFTEFLEMVEETFSEETADRIIDVSDLPSGGVYTSLGTYDHAEIIELVTHLSRETDLPVHDLVYVFGQHLFRQFAAYHSEMLGDVTDTFTLLERIEGYIHVEVRKLYEGAQLPSFRYERPSSQELTLYYRSERPFAVLAKGLIRECIDHFGESIDMTMTDLSDGAGTAAKFVLIKQS